MGTIGIPKSGNALIDDGHQRLLNSLVEIGGVLRQPNTRPEALALFREFQNDLRAHMGTEEIIMRSAGYAHLESHAWRHTELINLVNRLIDDLAYDPKVQPLDILDEVTDRLVEHELVEDSDIWPCLTGTGAEILTAWDLALETGIARVDEHHKAMVALMARLRTLPKDAPHAEVEELVTSLARLTELHFKTEEDIWSEGDPDSPLGRDHALDHQRLLDAFNATAPRLLKGELPLDVFVNDFLAEWLQDHIIRSDQPHFATLSGPNMPST
jgi:hemerythrin-like metal-binding protein